MRKGSRWLIALIITACLGVGVALSRPGRHAIYSIKHTMRTERFLIINNNCLFYLNQKFGLQPIYKKLAIQKAPLVTISSSPTPGAGEIRIGSGASIAIKKGNFTEAFYMPGSASFILAGYVLMPPDKSGRPSYGSQLWRWNKKTGFVALTQTMAWTGEFRYTLDQKKLFFNCADASGPGFKEISVYDDETETLTKQKADNNVLYSEAIIDDRTVIFAQLSGKRDEDQTRTLMRLDPVTKNQSELLPGRHAERAVTFDGFVWVLVEEDGKYSVLKFGPDLKKILDTISVE